MKVDDLTKDDLLTVMRSIMTGKTPDEALSSLVPEDIRYIVDLYHSILCHMNHTIENGCPYYTEQDWTGPSHVYFTNIVKHLMEEKEVSPKQFSEVLITLGEVERSRIYILKKAGEEGLTLFNYLLKLV